MNLLTTTTHKVEDFPLAIQNTILEICKIKKVNKVLFFQDKEILQLKILFSHNQDMPPVHEVINKIDDTIFGIPEMGYEKDLKYMEITLVICKKVLN